MTATTLSDIFDVDLLALRIEQGYVSTQTHPTLPLTILNYSPSAQYEREWDEVTTQCRGLIYHSETGEVVARPFAKFFNYGETDTYDALPDGDPIVSEKMDGSLGIIYTYKGVPRVATRGSFMSDQAQWATKFLWDHYRTFSQPEGVTTLVEILYKENRIVVDYGDNEGLVLLGAVDNATGADIPVLHIAFSEGGYWTGPVADHYEYHTLEDTFDFATGPDFEESEGVVLCWPRPNAPSFRLKIKHPRYIDLHRIVTNLSTRSVHEALANNTFDELIAVTPDEFHPWVRNVADDLQAQHWNIAGIAGLDLADARFQATHSYPGDGDSYMRKDLANEIQKNAAYPGLCFSLEDGKDISAKIWDMIRPDREMAVILEDG